MLKKYSIFLFLFISLFSYSQDGIGMLSIELKNDRNVFQIVDETNHKIIFFISDREKVSVFRFNEKMTLLDSLSKPRSRNKLDYIIGYEKKDNTYSLIWANSDYKKIEKQTFDFNTRTQNIIPYSLEYNDEKKILEIPSSDTFYIVTAVKNTNLLKFYSFSSKGNVDTKTVTLDNLNLVDANDVATDFYAILKESYASSQGSFGIQNINTASPTSLVDSSKKRKYYIENNKLIFTLDTNRNFTTLISIDLTDFQIIHKNISKPTFETQNKTDHNTSSFLQNNTLYQIVPTEEEIIITLKSLDDQLLNKYVIRKDDPITFANSKIIQIDDEYGGSFRYLDKPSQFIRKVGNLQAGISSFSYKGNNFVTIGSVSSLKDNNAIYGMLGGATGSLFASLFLNPTLSSYNAYTNRKVVYLNALLDNNGNHIEGDLGPIVFDKIKNWVDGIDGISDKTIFKIGDVYVFGYYLKSSKKYFFRKFID